MVGGKVIGIARRNDGVTLVNVQGIGSEHRDYCAVRCKETQPVINLNDGIWWQAGNVFVTSSAARHTLKQIGYSH